MEHMESEFNSYLIGPVGCRNCLLTRQIETLKNQDSCCCTYLAFQTSSVEEKEGLKTTFHSFSPTAQR